MLLKLSIWLHLGHNISNNGTDRVAISNCHSTFIGQANDVICWFNVLDYNINTKLLKRFVQVYTDSDVQAVCKAWRQALRRIWKLPASTGVKAEMSPLPGSR